MVASKEQRVLSRVIKKMVNGRIIKNYRPDFLKNVNTGKNLEIDIFIRDFGIGVEYQGMIHFKYIEKYKNNPDKSRYNDMVKFDMCLKLITVPIIEIFPSDLKGDVKANFINRLLIMQEFYFEKLQFIKCKLLERFYLHITTKHATGSTATFFEMCDKIKNYKKYNNPRNMYIGTLVSHIKNVQDIRPIFNIDRLAKMLSFDFHLEKLKRRNADTEVRRLTINHPPEGAI